MAKQHHTVIFVPHAHAKLRKWRVSNLQIGLGAGALLLLTLTAVFFTWSHFNTSVNPVEIARLRGENEDLRQVNLSFESSIKKLQDQLAESEDRTRQLAIVAGLENLESGIEAGVGGGTTVDEVGLDDLPAIEDRAGQLAGALDAVEAKLEERVRWISSTPAITPVKGILTSGFGYRSDPLTHGHGLHQGVDIAAAHGQPVRASADGIVMRATDQGGGLGKAVFLAHGFGLTTRYGHLSRIEVKPGQRIKRGDVIGRVGSTGRSTGPHLHYEVRMDGDPVNPLAYILDDANSF
jgi:murein DD-endopeptidase MepM/ murein hydrolase activator NlpD